MGKKKIEPTDAMVRDVESWSGIIGVDDVDLLRYALNHPDARRLFTDEDAADNRPWEPLGEGDPVRVGDEVKRTQRGVTRSAVVGCVGLGGGMWTDEGRLIGNRAVGTWYVRRPVKELPEADGAVIVPADGHEYIETRVGKKSRRLTWDAECLVWYDARGTHLHGDITPGTWKVGNR